MTDFEKIVEERLLKIGVTLGVKEKEYASNNDSFHNFRVAARIAGSTPEKALQGMWMKHIVSVFDLIENPGSATAVLIDEKIGDCVNYLILLEGLLRERINE